MKNFKKRLAVFLSILFVLPTILSVLPQTATEVQAATTCRMYARTGTSNGNSTTLYVMVGQKFCVGDYVSASIVSGTKYEYYSTVSSTSSTRYKSSNTSVASVDSKKGTVTPKKTGKTTISVSLKGAKHNIVLYVEKKGKYQMNSVDKKIDAAAKKVAADATKSINSKNAYSIYKNMVTYRNLQEKSTGAQIFYAGVMAVYDNNTLKYVIMSPSMAKIAKVEDKLYKYGEKNSALSTRSANLVKIQSVSATPTKITFKLKKKVNHAQILGTMCEGFNAAVGKKIDSKTAYASFGFTVADKYIRATVTMKEGSDTITISDFKYTKYKESDKQYHTYKYSFTKGKSYSFGSKQMWCGARRVKVK